MIAGLAALVLTGCGDHFRKKAAETGTEEKVATVTRDSTPMPSAAIPEPEPVPETFWLGADISWATGMEQRGQQLYSYEGDDPWECTALMKELGLNAVRFRVWVDPHAWELEQAEKRRQLLSDKPSGKEPVEEVQSRNRLRKIKNQDDADDKPSDSSDSLSAGMAVEALTSDEKPAYSHTGSCDREDLLVKALRAKKMGMAIMVDFHYSDSWADPKKQPVPLGWKGHSYEQMKQDLKAHTVDVLNYLKAHGIDVTWVQIGNEVSNGLLWSYKTGREAIGPDGQAVFEDDLGSATVHPDQYAGFIQAGCDAARSVYPGVRTIVHLDNGWDPALYEWNLGILQHYGVDYDMVGMSLYPYWAREEKGRGDADAIISDCMKNVKAVYSRFGKESMIVETGFEVNEANAAVMAESKRQFMRVLEGARHDTDGHCKGVFYWEPECRPAQYKLGAFTSSGRPTVIMDAFKEFQL